MPKRELFRGSRSDSERYLLRIPEELLASPSKIVQFHGNRNTRRSRREETARRRCKSEGYRPKHYSWSGFPENISIPFHAIMSKFTVHQSVLEFDSHPKLGICQFMIRITRSENPPLNLRRNDISHT